MLVICNHRNICKVPAGKCFHAEEHLVDKDDENSDSDCTLSGFCEHLPGKPITVRCVEV